MSVPIIDIIFPIFGLLLLGYTATRFGWFDLNAVRGLTRYVFDFAVPMLLLRTLSKANLPAELPWNYLGSYYLGTMLTFFFGMGLARFIWKKNFSEQVIHAFSGCFSNTVLLGIPVILLAFGERANLPLFLMIGTHGIIMIPVFTILLELGKSQRTSFFRMQVGIIRGLLTNPLILGLLSGIIFNFFNMTLWTPLDEMARLISNSVTPCALFALGATLAGFSDSVKWKEVPLLVMMKIVIHPFFVWVLAVYVLNVKDPFWIQVIVMLAAQPTGINPFLFASRYQVGESAASSAVFFSTTFSMLTLSVLLTIYN